VRGRDFAHDAFVGVTARFAEYLRGLPFTVEFHESIAPHPGSGKHQTIVVERRSPNINAVGRTNAVLAAINGGP